MEQFSKYAKEKDGNKEINIIIQAAAKLLLVDIKNIGASIEEYSSSAEDAYLATSLDYISPSLLLFLRTLLQGKKESDVKIASLGQFAVGDKSRKLDLLRKIKDLI